MQVVDLLRMSFSNLLRRKVRTFLTVLGVVIGTAAIVVMLSLGLGLRKSSMKQIEQSGGLTTITVRSNENQVAENGTKKIKRLDRKTVENVAKIPHIKLVSPVLQIDVLAKTGKYEANLTIKGINAQALADMNLEAGQGSLPISKKELQLFWGNQAGNLFYSLRGNADNPQINPMKDTIFYIFDREAYEKSQTVNTSGSSQPATPPKKFVIPACGILAGGSEGYSNHSFEIFADREMLEKTVQKAFRGKLIPGQPKGKNGKPYKELYYSSIYVRVDNINAMEDVQKKIREMGFEVESNMEWLKQVQEQMGTIQMALAGIGAVSLLVATIGIANTMMMSIYERTKEIGIIKVLGCDLSDIRKVFLLESGMIGFIGGLSGLLLSYGLSFAINLLTKESTSDNVSYIPLWLAAISIVFAVLVGMGAGFAPAVRAMRQSPLSALRNE